MSASLIERFDISRAEIDAILGETLSGADDGDIELKLFVRYRVHCETSHSRQILRRQGARRPLSLSGSRSRRLVLCLFLPAAKMRRRPRFHTLIWYYGIIVNDAKYPCHDHIPIIP